MRMQLNDGPDVRVVRIHRSSRARCDRDRFMVTGRGLANVSTGTYEVDLYDIFQNTDHDHAIAIQFMSYRI